jgi:hypothetical protein
MSVTKPALKRRIAILEKELHMRQAHPHFEHYHVKVGKAKTKYDLDGHELDAWPKATPVKVGVWFVNSFGMRKEVYAYRTAAKLGYIFEADADRALYDMLLDIAHRGMYAPGYQYSDIEIDSIQGWLMMPPIAKVMPTRWQLLEHYMSDGFLSVRLCRETPPGEVDGEIFGVEYQIRNTDEDNNPMPELYPITGSFRVQADDKGRMVGNLGTFISHPVVPVEAQQGSRYINWTYHDQELIVHLRLPVKQKRK